MSQILLSSGILCVDKVAQFLVWRTKREGAMPFLALDRPELEVVVIQHCSWSNKANVIICHHYCILRSSIEADIHLDLRAAIGFSCGAPYGCRRRVQRGHIESRALLCLVYCAYNPGIECCRRRSSGSLMSVGCRVEAASAILCPDRSEVKVLTGVIQVIIPFPMLETGQGVQDRLLTSVSTNESAFPAFNVQYALIEHKSRIGLRINAATLLSAS